MEDHEDFWDHIQELRNVILRSLGVMAIGTLLCLSFYKPLFEILTNFPQQSVPCCLVKTRFQTLEIQNHSTSSQIAQIPPQAKILSSPIKIKDHSLLLLPGESVIYEEPLEESKYSLLILSPIEGLMLVLKTCFWISCALTAPIWGWYWLKFILPALKTEERLVLLPFILGSFLCILIGVLLAYFLTLPIATASLASFNQTIGQNAWTLSSYLSYTLLLCLGHAIAAEIAWMLFLLIHFHFLSSQWLVEKRRYMWVFSFVLGALLTPPDVFTQFALAIPLVLLYEAGIGYAKWRENKQSYQQKIPHFE